MFRSGKIDTNPGPIKIQYGECTRDVTGRGPGGIQCDNSTTGSKFCASIWTPWSTQLLEQRMPHGSDVPAHSAT